MISLEDPIQISSVPEQAVIDYITSTKILSVTKILDVWDYYWRTGILPSSPSMGSSPVSYIEKSIHINYAEKRFVDVKRRSLNVWNLVGNGGAYVSVYGLDGELLRAGCGHLWKDEGLGCLHVEDHADGKALVKLIANSCMRPQCPVCYEKWAGREALRIDERFRRVPKLPDNRRSRAEDYTAWGVPIHVIVSVPEVDADLMDVRELVAKDGKFVIDSGFAKLKAKAVKIAKKVGFKGGCAIFHPFSNDEIDEAESEVKISVDPHSGEFDFKALKEYFARQNKDIKLWYVRPHFHLIGYGNIDGLKVAQNYRKTGWIVKNLGVRDSVVSTALYQLSHAGYREGQHTVFWVGFMSNRLFKSCNPYPPDVLRVRTCRYCERELVYVKWVGSGLSPLDSVRLEGEYKVDPPGWVEIAKAEYRGRVVSPLPGESLR